MATDYISREAAILEFCDDCMDREWCKSNGESCSRIKNINAVPAADVRPAIYGQWEYVSFMTVRCSNCKEIFHELEGDNFCPNCGADMREVKSNEK